MLRISGKSGRWVVLIIFEYNLMEAMKMMNEVQAPCDCVIEEILQEDGALVSFGEPLLRYREG